MYPIHQLPLYKIKGIGQFEKILRIKWKTTPKLLKVKSYHSFENKNGRLIQTPLFGLKSIHKRIGSLLSRIELPEYLHSKKGFSYVTNAKAHVGKNPLIKTDIHKFYPSTSRLMVYLMFVREFKCAVDVAHRLADLCCYEQRHLPTGSTLSGRVAFFAARPMFDEIDKLVKQYGCKLTLYVDDITISGENATKELLSKVRKIIRENHYRTENQKSMTFSAHKPKKVTGVIVTFNGLKVPNKQLYRIYIKRKELLSATGMSREMINKSLNGSLQAMKQILDA